MRPTLFDEHDDESELLNSLAQGSEPAFHEIYNRYQRRIFSFAYLLTESTDMAEDVVQEIFIKLWNYRAKVGDVVHFNSWIHTVTRNFVTDAMKKRAREVIAKKELGYAQAADSNSTDDIIFLKENEDLLRQAIDRLSPQQQVVYRLSREQGLSNREIAEQLAISPNTVKNHLVNTMRTIREYFRDNSELIVIIALYAAVN